MVVALAASAAKPCGVLISVRPLPSVRMTRQPPMYVPAAIARPQTATTQSSGPEPEGCRPTAMSVSVMMPMVFWASLVPCERATKQAVTV